MTDQRRAWLAYALLLLAAFGFRFFIARHLANDNPDDGRVYSQIARNLLEQHVYSHATEPPYDPSFIRLPGYPLFLAAIYAVFGHNNNTAVRIVQALIDTATCLLIALVAFQWAPEQRKRTASIAALALAAVCPFTAIYVSTILTEVPTNFLAVSMCLAATLALKAATRKPAFIWWAIAGLTGGIAVLFRPDSGLFAAAIGITIVASEVIGARSEGTSGPLSVKAKTLLNGLWRSVPPGAIFSLAFCLALVPWTIRNKKVFHLFQPLAPAHGEMPGEFVPRGYLLWLRTWLDDERYIGPLLWSLDASPINIDDLPDRAFDTEEERDRVEVLLEKYNHPNDVQALQGESPAPSIQVPQTGRENKPPPGETPQPGPTEEEPTQGDEEDKGDEQDTEQSDQENSQNQQDVEMTPEIDAGFAQIANERIARSRIRYFVVLPLRRGGTLWLDTHSQYYPFEGELLPLEDMDYRIHQQFWLPLFAGLTLIYTLLGVAGGWFLWRMNTFTTRRWVILACLIIFVRLGFFSTMENPEPRYAVEIFPFLSILGGIAIGQMVGLIGTAKRRSAQLNVRPAG
jgi:Dolichyl-phosphate-mannose-protein mannosyltransferase